MNYIKKLNERFAIKIIDGRQRASQPDNHKLGSTIKEVIRDRSR